MFPKRSRSIISTKARVTIENFWARSGRELGENFLRTFTNFDRGTVDFRHMGVQVSRINTKVYDTARRVSSEEIFPYSTLTLTLYLPRNDVRLQLYQPRVGF